MNPEHKRICNWIAGVSSLGVVVMLIYLAAAPSLTNRENTMLAVLVAILTTLASWLMSRHYAIAGNQQSATEKIDTVAKQSTEKMLNLSKQLFEIEDFLDEAKEMAEGQSHVMAANATLAHRLDSVAKMIYLLRNSNDTFTSDWIGVVSPATKEGIETQKRTQKEVLEELDNLRRSQRAESRSTQSGSPTKIFEALNRISEQASSLPEAIRPEIRIPAVSVSQQVKFTSPTRQNGTLTLTLHRPVYIATCTGKLEPQMDSSPHVYATLADPLPEGSPAISVHCGSLNNASFNVHLKSRDYGVHLKPGEYHLEYNAEPDQEVEAIGNSAATKNGSPSGVVVNTAPPEKVQAQPSVYNGTGVVVKSVKETAAPLPNSMPSGNS